MYKIDKTLSQAHNSIAADKLNIFSADVSLAERLRQSWYLTCMAFSIDPENPPKLIKTLTSMRKHEN